MGDEKQRVIIELDDAYVTNIQVSGNYTYIGKAPTGSLTSAAKWQIKRIDATTGTIIEWADGNKLFDNIYDDRATTVSYS